MARVLDQVERYGVPALEWFLRETQRLAKRVPAGHRKPKAENDQFWRQI